MRYYTAWYPHEAWWTWHAWGHIKHLLVQPVLDYVYLRYHTAMLDTPMKPGGQGGHIKHLLVQPILDYVYLRYHTAMLDIPMTPGGHGVTLNTYLSNQSWITCIWDIILLCLISPWSLVDKGGHIKHLLVQPILDYVYLRYHTAMLDIPMKPGGHGVTLNTYLSNQSWITSIWNIILLCLISPWSLVDMGSHLTLTCPTNLGLRVSEISYCYAWYPHEAWWTRGYI